MASMGKGIASVTRGAFFYGWIIVLVASISALLGYGVRFYAYGVFFTAIIADFGWSRTETSAAYSVAVLVTGVFTPFLGGFVDKFGPRIIMMVGGTIAGGALVVLSMISELWQLYVVFGFFVAIGVAMFIYVPSMTAIANWFVRKRSRAMGLLTIGGGLGGTFLVPLSAYLIDTYGWRTAFFVIGIMIWTIVVPIVAVFMRRSPEMLGLLPDGSPAGTDEKKVEVKKGAYQTEVDYSLSEALKTPVFWIMCLAFFLYAIALPSLVVHQIAFAVGVGVDRIAAAAALGLMTTLSIPGRLVFGWLGDIMDKRYVFIMTLLMQAAGIFILTQTQDVTLLYAYVVVYGLSYGGAIPLIPAICGAYFGRKNFGTIYGVFTTVQALASSAGPLFAGYSYDTTQSYTLAFTSIAAALLAASVVMVFARPPKHPAPVGKKASS